ncbi:hypothetical protein H9Q69_009324 [Fusarium xylarioides]|nr:hypothetical protein H9Q69_009324 [Fusarium xylarioides]
MSCKTGTKLVWEDDGRRAGMSRRGPVRKARTASVTDSNTDVSVLVSSAGPAVWSTRPPASLLRRVSDWPFELAEPEWRLLDHYVQRFSRTYPTFSAPDNPFLSIFLPLATQNRAVLDSLLALSGVQLWEDGAFAMEIPMLQLRQSAIQGSIGLLAAVAGARHGEGSLLPLEAQIDLLHNAPFADDGGVAMDNFVALLANCVLLLLYEKLSGSDQGAAMPHLRFLACLFPTRMLVTLMSLESSAQTAPTDIQLSLAPARPWSKALRFLCSLFLYNDLVRSVSNQSPTLSRFYYENDGAVSSQPQFDTDPFAIEEPQLLDRLLGARRTSLPNILAGCSAGDLSITEEDVAMWDGKLDWFPSFALVRGTTIETQHDVNDFALHVADPIISSEPIFASLDSFTDTSKFGHEHIISGLYRVATLIYVKQMRLAAHKSPSSSNDTTATQSNMGNLPTWGIQLLGLLPENSPWQSCVLWPIGIIARELCRLEEQRFIAEKLLSLQRRFKIKLYRMVRERLAKTWANLDSDTTEKETEVRLCG